VLFQHLFWFYSHPAVYIMVLPGMGVISELISTFSRKPVYGTDSWRSSLSSGHRLPVWDITYSSARSRCTPAWSSHSLVTSSPFFAIKVFTGRPRSIKLDSFETPMLYAFGFIGLFTIGGLTGLFLASLGLDFTSPTLTS